VIAISLQEGVPDPFTKLRAFRQQHKVTYPILSDEKGTVIQKFGFSGIPSTVIIDKTGKYVANPQTITEVVAKLQKLAK
jgi:peroxiredoxin